MPRSGHAGHRRRVKQVGGKMTMANYDRLRKMLGRHMISLPDLLELVSLHMKDDEVVVLMERDRAARLNEPAASAA